MKGLVSHSLVGRPQILPPSLCRKSRPAREAQDGRDGGWGEERQGCRGSAGWRCCCPDSQPMEPTSTGMRGSHTRPRGTGASGHAWHQAAPAARSQEADSASHAGQQAVPPTSQRKPVPGPLLSAALGATAMVSETKGACPISEPLKDNLTLKLSEGFSSLSACNVPPLLHAFFRSHLLNRGYPDGASSVQWRPLPTHYLSLAQPSQFSTPSWSLWAVVCPPMRTQVLQECDPCTVSSIDTDRSHDFWLRLLDEQQGEGTRGRGSLLCFGRVDWRPQQARRVRGCW